MSQETTVEIAYRTLDIIPLVMRVMSSEMRLSKHAPASGHMSLLGMLAQRPYMLNELAERHSVSSPTMSSTVTTLEERGWVKRERSTEDRRVVWVSITLEGRNVLDEIQHQVAQRIAALLDGISEADQQHLIAGLTILRDSFAAALAQDPQLRQE